MKTLKIFIDTSRGKESTGAANVGAFQTRSVGRVVHWMTPHYSLTNKTAGAGPLADENAVRLRSYN